MASIVLIKIQLYILKLRAEHQHPDHVLPCHGSLSTCLLYYMSF
ncbi:unnamed protein product, partial [Brassica rapa subsp. narinosa]